MFEIFLFCRFEFNNEYVHKVIKADIKEVNEDQIEYYPAPNNELDAKSTFTKRNLLFFSNYLSLSESVQSLNCSGVYLPCLSGGCYAPEQKCDGIKNCEDGVDERACLEPSEAIIDELKVSKSAQ